MMEKYSSKIWKQILYQNRTAIVVLSLAAFCSIGLNLLPALVIQWFIDGVLTVGNKKLLLPAFFIIVTVFLLKETVKAVFDFIYQQRINKIVAHIRFLLLESVINRTYNQFRKESEKTFNILINDINSLWSNGAQQVPHIILSTLIGFGAAIYLISINMWLFLISMVVTLITIVPIQKISDRQGFFVEEAHTRELQQTNFIKEFFDKPLFIKTNYNIPYYKNKFQYLADRLLVANLRRELNFRWFLVIRQVSDALLPTAVYGIGGWLFFSGRISLGEIISSSMLIRYITEPITQASQYYFNLKEIIPRVQRINKVLDTYQRKMEEGNELRLEGDFQITFDRVSLELNGVSIFKELSFSFNKGENCIVTGRSGSGKTSLFNLLLKIYEPTEGELLINGVPYQNYSADSIKNLISIVPQDSIFFSGTIRENLLLVNENATEEEIHTALYISNSDEFIQDLPDGVDTLLADNANNLSGGQRQRLAIARSLLKKTAILLLDEAVSALDPRTAKMVLERINKLQGITVLQITHRIDLEYEHSRVIEISPQSLVKGVI